MADLSALLWCTMQSLCLRRKAPRRKTTRRCGVGLLRQRILGGGNRDDAAPTVVVAAGAGTANLSRNGAEGVTGRATEFVILRM